MKIFIKFFKKFFATIELPFDSIDRNKKLSVKYILSGIFLMAIVSAHAQKVDSIYVHLYTDSLKKGTYNYINIDGKMSNGHYIPLDSTDLIFNASDGKFFGNSLWVPGNFNKEKITIRVVLRSNPAICKAFNMYIKKKPDPDLKTEEEILKEMKMKSKKKHG